MLTPDKVGQEHLDQIAVRDDTEFFLASALEKVFEAMRSEKVLLTLCFHILRVLYGEGYPRQIAEAIEKGEIGESPSVKAERRTLYAYTLLWLMDDCHQFFQKRLALEVEVYQALGYESRDMIGALLSGVKRLDKYNKPIAGE